MKLYFIISTALFFHFSVFAQYKDLYSATEEGDSLEVVRTRAYMSLAQQIQVFVSTQATSIRSRNGSSISKQDSSITLLQSSLVLNDVEESVKKTDDGRYSVTKSISGVSVKKMFAQRKQKALDYISEASNLLFALNRAQVVDIQTILKHYYKAYLLATIHPEEITYQFSEGTKPISLLIGIPSILTNIVSKISVEPVKKIPDELIVWKLRVNYEGKPVQRMQFTYQDGKGETQDEIIDGYTQVTLNFPGSQSRERIIRIYLNYLEYSELDDLLKYSIQLIKDDPFKKYIDVKLSESLSVVSSQIPKSLLRLMELKNNDEEVLKELSIMMRKGIIVQGKKEDFESLDGLYVAVVGRSGLIALLNYKQNKYNDLISGTQKNIQEYSDIKNLWFELLK